jgi:hypothetical protein
MRNLLAVLALGASTALAAGADDQLAKWSLEAATFDCPMTPTEARALQSATGGAFDAFAADIGCACSVNIEGGILSRPSCRVGESVTRFQSENMASQKEQMMAEMRAQRAAGEKGPITIKPKVSAEALRLIDWVMRLKEKAALPADQLKRKVPLDSGKDAPVILGKDEELTKTFMALRHDYATFQSTADGEVWDSAETMLETLHTDLENHERITLNGKQSAAGRALIAEAKKRMKDGAQQLGALKRMKADPQYAKLEAVEGKLSDDLRTFTQLWGKSACSSNDPGATALCNRRNASDKAYRALAAKYGVNRP